LEFEYVVPLHRCKNVENRQTGEEYFHEGALLWEPVDIKEIGEQYDLGVMGRQIRGILRKETYPCAFCRGSGEKPRGSTCPVCRGKGVVFVTPPAMICAFCKGRGEERPRTNITCVVCRGKGVVPVREPLERCRRCKGRGVDSHSKLPCVECKGKGVVTVKGEKV